MYPLRIGKPTEAVLKSPATRRRFFAVLRRNLRRTGFDEVKTIGALVVAKPASVPMEWIMGLKYVERGMWVYEWDTLMELAEQISPSARVKVSRYWKGFSMTSLEIRNEILKRAAGSRSYLSVVVLEDGFLVGLERHQGLGGLPLGTQRPLGVRMDEDWPVGVFYLMRRGSPIRMDNPPPCVQRYHMGYNIEPPTSIESVISTHPRESGFIYPIAGLKPSILEEEQRKWCANHPVQP